MAKKTWHGGEECPGCVGRGLGGTCSMCGQPVPESYQRGTSSPSEIRGDCRDCATGNPHSHITNRRAS